MSWKSRNRVKSYLRASLWIIPVVAAVLQQFFAALVFALDARVAWDVTRFGLDGAKALCAAVITFSLSFVVFTFGSLLVAIQVARGQYTPRIIATTLLRDNVIRCTVGIVHLTETLPAERHPHLHQELRLLDRMLEHFYLLPEDPALARIPDSQGLGGSAAPVASKWAA